MCVPGNVIITFTEKKKDLINRINLLKKVDSNWYNSYYKFKNSEKYKNMSTEKKDSISNTHDDIIEKFEKYNIKW